MMIKQDITKILLVLCGMMSLASLSFASNPDEPLNPEDAPSECKKNGAVLDVKTLRQRIAGTSVKKDIWIDRNYGFQFSYPAGLKPSRQFEKTYLQDGNWSYFSKKKNGFLLVSIGLPTTPAKSTIADIRIGVNEDPAVVAQCLAVPDNADPKSLKKYKHKGIFYTYYKASDSAMSKSLDIEAYRTVHQNRCYSIELMVNAVNPLVQEPPDTKAMKPDVAMKKLTTIWRQMDFKWLP